jgi:cobyrinic acid a,c-diamide synthase
VVSPLSAGAPGSIPRLVIAAPSSGSGKTTVATGLMAAFAARGLAVSPHKVGPDYIDPGYHALATGRPGRNLDSYLCGPELIAPLFLHGSRGAGLAVIEGVMGLYDGATGHGELASTAHVAKLLRAPVVLVVDASSQARSVAALVHGFASFDPEVRIGGVILNKVGSPRHEEILRAALAESGVPTLGALHRAADLHVPSRHLGLVPAAERAAQAADWIHAAADRVRESCDLEALLALARSAPPLTAEAWDPETALRTYGPRREPEQKSYPSTRSRTRPSQPAPQVSSSVGASPSSTPKTSPRTNNSAKSWPTSGAPSQPNAQGSSTSPATWRAVRCAACSTPPPP